MSRTWKVVTALCGAAILATVVASPAAGCVDPPTLLSRQAWAPLRHSPGTGSPAPDGKGTHIGAFDDLA
jgi:hypothetical protein